MRMEVLPSRLRLIKASADRVVRPLAEGPRMAPNVLPDRMHGGLADCSAHNEVGRSQ